MECGLAGSQGHCLLQKYRGLGKLALLLPQDAQHFQGVDLLGIAAENGRVATRGRGEMPGLIKLKCVGQILLQSDDHHIGSASAHYPQNLPYSMNAHVSSIKLGCGSAVEHPCGSICWFCESIL